MLAQHAETSSGRKFCHHRFERTWGSGDVAEEAMEEELPGGCDNY